MSKRLSILLFIMSKRLRPILIIVLLRFVYKHFRHFVFSEKGIDDVQIRLREARRFSFTPRGRTPIYAYSKIEYDAYTRPTWYYTKVVNFMCVLLAIIDWFVCIFTSFIWRRYTRPNHLGCRSATMERTLPSYEKIYWNCIWPVSCFSNVTILICLE